LKKLESISPVGPASQSSVVVPRLAINGAVRFGEKGGCIRAISHEFAPGIKGRQRRLAIGISEVTSRRFN